MDTKYITFRESEYEARSLKEDKLIATAYEMQLPSEYWGDWGRGLCQMGTQPMNIPGLPPSYMMSWCTGIH